jgi:hypothetical protein
VLSRAGWEWRLLGAFERFQERHGGSTVAAKPLSHHRAHAATSPLTVDLGQLISRHDLLAFQPVALVQPQMNTMSPECRADILVKDSREFPASSQQLRHFNYEMHNRVRIGRNNSVMGG